VLGHLSLPRWQVNDARGEAGRWANASVTPSRRAVGAVHTGQVDQYRTQCSW
jgi:hypothetical protein